LTLRLITDGSSGEPDARDPHAGELDAAAFEELFEHAGALLAVLDNEAYFIAVNPACRRVLGLEPRDLLGRSLLEFVQPHSPAGVLQAKGDNDGAEQRASDRVVELLARHQHANGSWRWLLWSGAVHGERWYAAARDVTDWMRLEDRVGRDPLTQLPNREVFAEEVTNALARHERSGQRLAVLFLDIDSLKQINDSIGHEAGDRLVVQVAERLRLAVRTGDVVARLGGDEFGILVESLGDEHEAVAVAQRALAALDEPIDFGSGPTAVSASIGVSSGYGPPSTASTLIHEADLAMYHAKATGRNGIAIFDAELRAELARKQSLAHDLRAALDCGEFAMHYQPIISLRDGAVIGCEGLLRWEHPERGVVPPTEFMPVAEQTGLIIPLGLWGLRAAAAQAAAWQAAGSDIFVALDVSAKQLADDEFVAGVRSILEATEPAQRTLGIEITEQAALADPARTARQLAALSELGVRVAFDNFGSGYASLLHLIQLPVDAIKLDRAFVGKLISDQSRASRAVLLAVVAAAAELEIDIVADGVVAEQQRDELLAAGCCFAQGPLFAAATSAAELSLEPYSKP